MNIFFILAIVCFVLYLASMVIGGFTESIKLSEVCIILVWLFTLLITLFLALGVRFLEIN